MMSMKSTAAGGGGGGGGGTTFGGGRSLLSATPPSLTRTRRTTNSSSSSSFFIIHPSNSSSSSSSLSTTRSHHLRLVFVAKAADSTPTPTSSSSSSTVAAAAAATNSTKSIVPDNEFTLAKVSFGVIGLGLGVSLLSYGFGAYFNILPGSEWSAIMLTYGFPLAIIGMALQYAALKPVPCITYSDAESLREKCATPILKQVRNDVIRYRYGDEQHLEEALKRIFQYGLGGGISRRSAPQLKLIREEVTEDGKYALVLVFEAKALQLSDFEKRQAKFASFFGPGITSKIGKGENDIYEVSLISNTES